MICFIYPLHLSAAWVEGVFSAIHTRGRTRISARAPVNWSANEVGMAESRPTEDNLRQNAKGFEKSGHDNPKALVAINARSH